MKIKGFGSLVPVLLLALILTTFPAIGSAQAHYVNYFGSNNGLNLYVSPEGYAAVYATSNIQISTVRLVIGAAPDIAGTPLPQMGGVTLHVKRIKTRTPAQSFQSGTAYFIDLGPTIAQLFQPGKRVVIQAIGTLSATPTSGVNSRAAQFRSLPQ